MKKTLFLAVMASAALAGCVKNEEVAMTDGSPERITFEAPVVSIPTRATEIYGNYPTGNNFAVYALYHENTFPTSGEGNAFTATNSGMYMTNVTCSYTGKTGNEPNQYWAPATDYYWPKKGYLTFAAYAPVMTAVPAEDTGTAVGVKWGDTGFTFQNFEVNDEPTQQIDLLYSDRVYDKQKGSVVENQPYDGITIPFKHALSSIVFTARTEAYYPNNVIKLNKITVKNVVKKGDFAQNLTGNTAGDTADPKPAWNVDATTANIKDYDVFDDINGKRIYSGEIFVNGKPDEGDTADEYTTTTDDKGNVIPTGPNTNNGIRRSDLILIPQNLKRGDADTDQVSVEITYTIEYKTTTSAGTETTVSEKNTVALQMALKTTTASNTNVAWEMGKRYIYHIVIGLDKIYFNPQVVNWDDVTNTDLVVR